MQSISQSVSRDCSAFGLGYILARKADGDVNNDVEYALSGGAGLSKYGRGDDSPRIKEAVVPGPELPNGLTLPLPLLPLPLPFPPALVYDLGGLGLVW